MTKSEKSLISKEFARIRKFGYRVINFNSYKTLNEYMKDFVDIVIFNAKFFILIEVKTESTKDKLTPEQIKSATLLSNIEARNKTFYYRQIRNLQEAKNLVDFILQNKL